MKQFTLFILLSLSTFFASAQVVYVNRAATGANNGTSWANAYTNLRTAMRVTSTVGRQIWVAAGTYRVDTISGFVMNPGVQLYGGFAGTETALGQRNATTNVTILSGDITGDDTPGNFTANRTDNAQHVIWLAGADTVSRAVIDGFAIRGGRAAGATPPATPAPTIAALAASRGGGILTLTKVTIRNCVFTDNSGTNGAAISTLTAGASSIIVRDCRFEGNLTGERSIVYYQGLRNGECRRNVFTRNSTARGCFMADGSRAIIMDSCTYTRNRVPVGLLCAGAYSLGSLVTFSNSTFQDLRSDGASGMWLNANEIPNSVMTVNNCLFERDSAILTGTAGGNGGALQITSGALVTMTNCTFRQNFATSRGGACFSGSTAVGLSKSIMRNCTFDGNRCAGTAGCVWLQNAGTELTTDQCVFTNNVGASAGAIFAGFASKSTITNSQFEKNIANSGGGAVFSQSLGSLIVAENSRFNENKAGSGTSGFGGAALVGFYGGATFTNCTFNKNESFGIGGALYAQNDTSALTVTSCTFTENNARTLGGAIFQNVGPDVVVNTSTFTTNAADIGAALYAGGSAADRSTLIISRSKFLDNAAGAQGGALNLDGALVTTITNSLFAQNIGDNGGAISCNASDRDTTLTTITYCTFDENIGSAPCLVQFEQKDSLRAQATMILQNNAFGTHSGNIYTIEEGTPTVTSRGGNISSDQSLSTVLRGTNDQNGVAPRFVNAGAGNYRPAAGSPAIDKAIPVAGITVDLDGVPRGNLPDIGPYEGSTVSVFEPVKALRIDMSPNPTANQVVLRVNDDTRGTAVVDFFDVSGRLVLQLRGEKAAGEWAITQSVGHWTPGVYQVRLSIGGTLYSGTLVKE